MDNFGVRTTPFNINNQAVPTGQYTSHWHNGPHWVKLPNGQWALMGGYWRH